MSIQAQIGLIHNYTKKQHLQAAITHKAVAFVMSVKRQHSTLNTTPQPWNWFNMQNHVNDSKGSKYLCQIRGGNAQLGNRYKNRYGFKYEFCPHCENYGLHCKLTETHVIFECPIVASLRRELKLSKFIATYKAKGPLANFRILRKYLGGDGSNGKTLTERGRKLAKIIEGLLTAVHEHIQ